jgi:PKD domain
MRSMIRLLVLTLLAGLVMAGSAQAVIQDNPQFSFSTHTKAEAGAGNAVTMTLRWLPPVFLTPGPNNHQEVTVRDLAGGSPQTFSAGGPTANSIPLLLSNGHDYEITVAACENAGTCVLGSVSTAQASGTTRVDATPPSGTVQINGGAAATNNRTVTLNLAAGDPLIDGLPGTSSGVTQSATDVDGDGTFPCSIIFNDPNPDFSGCAVNFNPATPATLPAGDGIKKVGVVFGDGARSNTVPCSSVFCVITLGSPILGNASAAATDEILLDTVKPIALATQDRFVVERGGTVRFDATTSVDQNPAAASGVNPATATWQFKDGTPQATGGTVSHVFNQAGTFVGELRVRDRAGNLSDPRAFAVTVTGAGDAARTGTLRGITGTAAFSLDRLRVRARYVRSKLKGSIILAGSSTQAGPLRAELRRSARGRVVGRLTTRALRVGAFTRTLKLPASLLPGTYRLAFVGPGGTLRTTLTLKPPREGVIRSGRISRAGVAFSMAAQPVRALRGRLTVAWSQGSRSLATVPVASGPSIRAALPGGAGSGRLRAVLRAGGTVVGSASGTLR